jgi:hypothetical protein
MIVIDDRIGSAVRTFISAHSTHRDHFVHAIVITRFQSIVITGSGVANSVRCTS